MDEPRRTVEGADKLIAAVMQRLADSFANERSGLEKQWDSGDNLRTEELRVEPGSATARFLTDC